MENHKDIIPQEPQSVSMFAYELYRDILLPEIFGKDTADIFYWAGKQLARKFPLLSIDEICSFFEEACWGTLQVIKEEKKSCCLNYQVLLYYENLTYILNHFFRWKQVF